jgi:hypothetical protein
VNFDVNPPTHVFSLNPGLAVGVLARILTATVQSLDEGLTRRSAASSWHEWQGAVP